VAAQLGAHIIKVKPSTEHIEQAAAKKVYESEGIDISSLAARTKHVVQCAFGGRRIVIFSGGPAKGESEVLEEITGLAQGGAFGSIVGRNAFQRPKAEAISLLEKIQAIHREA
jgi:class I fructose-bisphosphate aldolase